MHRDDLVAQAILVPRADVEGLQLELLRDLPRPKERQHVGRLEDDRLLPLRGRDE